MCYFIPGGLYYAWLTSQVGTLIVMILVSIAYILICLYATQRSQLKVSYLLTYLPTYLPTYLLTCLLAYLYCRYCFVICV